MVRQPLRKGFSPGPFLQPSPGENCPTKPSAEKPLLVEFSVLRMLTGSFSFHNPVVNPFICPMNLADPSELLRYRMAPMRDFVLSTISTSITITALRRETTSYGTVSHNVHTVNLSFLF